MLLLNINLNYDSYMTQLKMTAMLIETRVSWFVSVKRSVIVVYN